MPSDRTHLLIPIHVDALVVGKDDKGSNTPVLKNGTVSAAPDYSSLEEEYLVGPELRQPREKVKPPLGKGVHLHFRLPAVAAHGDLNKTPAFPKIPNRWLVQRYYKKGTSLQTKTWLVYSDREAEDVDSAVTLLFPSPAGTPGDLYRRPTGVASIVWDGARAAAYNWNSDNQPSEVELTAVTGGDPGFSAHYPACRSILGLYDNLEDLYGPSGLPPSLQISYLVTGWYSGLGDDPWHNFVASLAPVQKEQERITRINQWMEERGCRKDFTGKPLPQGILCHGSVQDVRFQTNGSAPSMKSGPFEEFEKLEGYWVDLGNTSAEAFAARAAKTRTTKDPADRGLLEDLVTALQTGLFSQGSDAAELDAELHRQGFAAVAGGKVWVIQQATTAKPGEAPASSPNLPAELEKQLDLLNRLESQCDRHERLFRGYQWELYALWYRWTAAARDQLDVEAELKPNLDKLMAFLALYRGELNQARTARDNAKHLVGLKLQEHSQPPSLVDYSLSEEPNDPFYAPKDPVLLLTGAAAQAKGTKSRPASVAVRVTGEELQSFTYDLDVQRPNQTFTATDAWLTALGVSPDYLQTLPPWSEKLFREALLLDEIEADKKYLETKKKFDALADGPYSYGRFRWLHNPWIPLYLYWVVSWEADGQPNDKNYDLAPDLLKNHWTLKNEGSESSTSRYHRNTELILTKPPSSQGGELQCNGLTFVGVPLFNLQYDRAVGTNLERLMEPINVSLGSRRTVMLSQPLSGLHDLLMMRKDSDQLLPLDYRRWENEDGHPLYLDPITRILGDFHSDACPVTAVDEDALPFHPLRTGLLKLQDLRMIDVFGQTITAWQHDPDGNPANLPSLCQSGRLEAAPPPAGFPPSVRLYPRFCRPMRLKFAGIPASTGVQDPICGWVVLNRFDQNLVLYTADGRPVGILQKHFDSEANTRFYWVSVPGSVGAHALPSGITNIYLRDFAEFVLALEYAAGGSFAKLIDDAVEATERRVPEDNPAISILLGRPLALVRAELRLETDGLPALDQEKSWTAQDQSGSPSLDEILQQSLKTATAPPPNPFMKTRGVEKVHFPVRLGDRRSTNDGLVGFFKGQPPAGREAASLHTHPFYSSWGFKFGNVSYSGLRQEQDLELDGETRPHVTLLMDPQARVHVTSGVLPKVALELTASQLKAAKQVREVFFQAAPVLGTPTTPYVPKPSDDYGQWSWTYRPNVTGWAEDPNAVSAAELTGPGVGWPTLSEGWLKLKIAPILIRSLWRKAPANKPQKGTNVTLAWSLQGADSLAVFRLRPDGSEETNPEKKWTGSPLVEEFSILLHEHTTFRIRASNQAGFEEYKDIVIEIEE